MAVVHLRPTYSPLHPPDQHLHDPPVQLRQRPAGPVHLQESGALRGDLDQPEDDDAAAHPAGPEVLQPLPLGERPPVAGERTPRV